MTTSPTLRQQLLDQTLPGNPSIARAVMHRVTLDAGQATGRHFHPCPVIGQVIAGALRLQVAGGPNTILRPGDAFYEPANTEVPYADNASNSDPVTFTACYLLPPGNERLIEMLGDDA